MLPQYVQARSSVPELRRVIDELSTLAVTLTLITLLLLDITLAIT